LKHPFFKLRNFHKRKKIKKENVQNKVICKVSMVESQNKNKNNNNKLPDLYVVPVSSQKNIEG